MYFDYNFYESLSLLRSNHQIAIIGSDNDLAPNRRRDIIWTNDILVY